MDRRLQQRFWRLVREQMDAAQAIAAGLKALPSVGRAFASTQAAWRFYSNPRVTLPALAEPLRDAARTALTESSAPYALLIHDWSKINYRSHSTKTDQLQLTHVDDVGYELTTALLVDARTGVPLAPMELELRAADGVHTTRRVTPAPPEAHLQQILPTMRAARKWGLSKPLVHIIDREGDSLAHFREWTKHGQLLLIRMDDDRSVKFRGQRLSLKKVRNFLQEEGEFQPSREVEIRGQRGQQFVAEAEVVLYRPGRTRMPDGKRKEIAGPPLTMRFIVVQVRNAIGNVLAEWFLISNVPSDVPAEQLALWYYWRWRIESFFKLLKSAGQQMESWQQESAAAIARRLLVAAMACVTVWHLQRQTSPLAVECQTVLVRLSGRQTKRTRPVTAPALLAGLHVLLQMLEILKHYSVSELHRLTEAIPFLPLTG
jgi:hypothetical protein